jgi:hypothetical protein
MLHQLSALEAREIRRIVLVRASLAQQNGKATLVAAITAVSKTLADGSA